MLHQEVDGCSTLTTREALTNLLGGRHHERWRLIIVERAQTLIVYARLFKRNKLAHHIYDVRGIEYLVYRFSVNHTLWFHKDKVNCCYQTECRCGVIPMQLLMLENKVGDNGKNHQRYALLYNL